MAEITAAMVRELRDRTDAPMMECKKALVEANGDLAKAEELLRIRLGNKASKASSRTAAEGIVAIHVDGRTGAIVEVYHSERRKGSREPRAFLLNEAGGRVDAASA